MRNRKYIRKMIGTAAVLLGVQLAFHTTVVMGEEIDRSEVFQLLEDMNIGWNLGNTLDAHSCPDLSKSETYWGNPETTKEMLEAIAAQGFNTVRIPVTWAEHISGEDYAIDPAWMDRVQEVVDYAIDTGMYVVLDTHHEPDFWLKPDQEHAEEVEAELTAIWSQISERFRDYDSHLLFEGMNEPRIKGSEKEWSGGTKEERQVVNQLNAAFVRTVRASGGGNADRCLIICTYGHAANFNTIMELEIPEDEHIAVAVHLYTPYVFTFEGDSGHTAIWDGSKKKDIIMTMQMVDKYLTQKGVPVLITEFGAVTKTLPDGSLNTEDVVNWISDYLEVTNRYGLKCIWWDNGNYTGDGERFGIFNRRELSFFAPEIADALISCAEKAE